MTDMIEVKETEVIEITETELDVEEAEEVVIITATLVPEEKRMEFLPKLIGDYPMAFERYVYQWMEKLTKGIYTGGLWEFYNLSNGGGYISFCGSKPFTMYSMNGAVCECSNETASIVANIFALSSLMQSMDAKGLNCEVPSKRYYQLLDFAYGTPESAMIQALID